MSDPSGTKDDPAVKLMRERLMGTERNAEELAKMLVELGITPNVSPEWIPESAGSTPDFLAMTENLLKSDSAVILKPKGHKHVTFDSMPSDAKHKASASVHSILKKDPIKPLQVNFNSTNIDENKVLSTEDYSKLVNRLCKTESVIQSLKLSLCSMKAKHESSDKEKTLVITKLKDEIKEQDTKLKEQQEDLLEEKKRRGDYHERWEDAEKQVVDLHQRIEDLNKKTHLESKEDGQLKEKFNRRIEEARTEVAREREVREVVEKSHISLLSRVHDMEEVIQHERNQCEELRQENQKLRETNSNYSDQTTNWTTKAAEMENVLLNLKTELDAKEKAIKRLIDEQDQNAKESCDLASKQSTLSKELKQCNILMDAQKSAFSQLEAENKKLSDELEKERSIREELEEWRRGAEEKSGKSSEEEKMRRSEMEKKLKADMRQAVNREKRKFEEAEARISLLEEVIKKQEESIKDKEDEMEAKEAEMDERLFQEKKKVNELSKERDQEVRCKENLMKDLNKAVGEVNREKEFLQQQVEEMKLEQEVTSKERHHLEEENNRLMDRMASVEHQEAAYRHAQDLATTANTAKSQLAYDNGKLQTRVEHLEEELRAVASVQSQAVQLRATNRALEQKYSQLSSELASARVDNGRTASHIKQLQSGMSRKESDFHLAIAARDEALQEKEAALAQVDAVKEQERSRSSQLMREFSSCRSDNERLSSALAEVSSRFQDLQERLDAAQSQLGRKDAQIGALQEEGNKLRHEAGLLEGGLQRAEGELRERDTVEQSRIAPALDALEQARRENQRLAASLEDVLRTNAQMKEDVDKYRTDLEIQRERADMLSRQQEAHAQDVAMATRSQSDRVKQMKEQFDRERATLKRQMQARIGEVKKASEATQTRNSQLTRGNSELRTKLASQERVVAKLRDRVKQQKSVIDRHQGERKSSAITETKLKEIDHDLVGLEKTKESYMKKNKDQATIIATFNSEVTSLKDDIAALSHAQKIARETTLKLEAEVSRERAEKEILINKIESLDGALKRALGEKQASEEKLRKVQIESIHVQQNLQEAQSWFKDKFEVLQGELSARKDDTGSLF